MSIEDLTTIDQVTAFLEGTQRVIFEVPKDKDIRYQWVQRILVKFHYLSLSRPDKGVLIRYLMRLSGYSRQQLTRLIKQYRDTGRLVRRQSTVNGFARRFTAEDIRLLAAMDERHNTPNGLTMKKLCERAYTVYDQAKYQRLASISVAHLYNLRKATGYVRYRRHVEKTRPRSSRIRNCGPNSPSHAPDRPMTTDSKGKQRKRYPYDALKTPYEKLKSLPRAATYLKPGLSFGILDAIAHEQSDNEAADQLQKARRQLFKLIHERDRKRA